METVKRQYNNQYEKWAPWLEDQYLYYFGKDNKASYVTKQQLEKSKVTGIKQVDTLQDGVNNLVGDQVGKGGLLQPVGDLASKEGVNRMERQGKDDNGAYAPGPMNSVANPVAENAKAGGSAVAGGAQTGANKAMEGAKNAGGYLGGMSPFGKKKEDGKE